MLSLDTLLLLQSINHSFHFVFFLILTVLLISEYRQRNGITAALCFLFLGLSLGSLHLLIYSPYIFETAARTVNLQGIIFTRVVQGWLVDLAIIYLILIFLREKNKRV